MLASEPNLQIHVQNMGFPPLKIGGLKTAYVDWLFWQLSDLIVYIFRRKCNIAIRKIALKTTKGPIHYLKISWILVHKRQKYDMHFKYPPKIRNVYGAREQHMMAPPSKCRWSVIPRNQKVSGNALLSATFYGYDYELLMMTMRMMCHSNVYCSLYPLLFNIYTFHYCCWPRYSNTRYTRKLAGFCNLRDSRA